MVDPTQEVDLVVVYGTLRLGERANYMLEGCEFLGHTSLAGTMFSLGGFPGIKLDGPGTFHGEVYRISHEARDRVVQHLDGYEGCRGWGIDGGLYNRRVVETNMGPAFIYEYDGDGSRYAPIEGGDWVEWRTAG